MRLPGPSAVLDGASAAGARVRDEGLAHDASVPNVVVEMGDSQPEVERRADGYVGKDAPALGLLAVAVETEGIALQYPEPDLTAEGPWLVLYPLSGFVSTVSTGTGRTTVELDYDRAADYHLGTIERYVDDLLAAARPAHGQYPVADDSRGIFRTGMTTFAPTEVTTTEESVTVRFDVSTTPETSHADIKATFEDIDGVVNAEYESAVGVERAEPSDRLRSAVEDAHRTHVGDAQYEWVPEPTVFSRIPGGEKIALGPGVRGAGEFSDDTYATGVELLTACVENLRGDGE